MGRAFGLLLGLIFGASGTLADPARVVSMNLCTDQLAMMVAAPGQLVSVSYIARDKRASAMADDAMAYPVNHGLAEEIYLLKPDLVIAGSFSTRATTDMLRRLGVPVVVFEPTNSLEDVSARLRQMGEVLGRTDTADALIAEYETRLNRLLPADDNRPRAALYSANGYTSGHMSLAGQIVEAAGLYNIARDYGYDFSGTLPLELLALSDPDLLVGTRPYARASRSEDVLAHPVVHYFAARSRAGQMRDGDWVCGTPHVLRAVEALMSAREDLQVGQNTKEVSQ